MTLPNDPAKEIKLGNDATIVFSFTFVINTADDMVVIHTDSSGVETPVTEGTGTNNYSISVANYPGNGSITYPATLGTELPTGEKLTLSRVVDLDQETDLQNQAQYKPETVEATFDYGRMIDLQQQEQIDRSIKAPISDNSGADYTLPAPTTNTVIGVWNAAGDAIIEGPTANEISNANASAVAAAANAALTAADVVTTNADVVTTNADVVQTNADVVQTNADVVSSAANAAAAIVAKIEWQNAWLVGTAYNLNDAVEDLDSSYICIQANTGNQPTVGGDAFWDVLAAKGFDGVGSGDLLAANNLSDVANAATSLSNIGGIGAATTNTLTNKTFNANGTGNSLSNVDVSDLSNGTDGELITWNAAGEPATVAVGTVGQVLTSGGAGVAPTMQDAGGGNAPIAVFDASNDGDTGSTFAAIFEPDKSYRVLISGLVPTSDGTTFQMKFTEDDGVTYRSGTNYYAYMNTGTNTSAASNNSSGLDNSSMRLVGSAGVGSAGQEDYSAEFIIHTPARAGVEVNVTGSAVYDNNGNVAHSCSILGRYRTPLGTLSGFQIEPGSGSLESGRISVFEIPMTI